VSLVDGPRDIKFEMVARAVGRERALEGGSSSSGGIGRGREEIEELGLRELTRRNMEKVLKYRGEGEKSQFERKAAEFGVSRRVKSGYVMEPVLTIPTAG
jgi:large subunit ribosomal protein L17